MLLVADAGNSEVTAGLFDGDRLIGRWRLATRADRTPDEWWMDLSAFVARVGTAPEAVDQACLASVVPAVTTPLVEAAQRIACGPVHVLDAATTARHLPLILEVDEPDAVGADRIALALGALERHPGDAIVIGFGTATTFNCLRADGRFFGGSIMPGVRTAGDQLIRRAARLSATDWLPPARAIARTTDDNVRGGVLFGAADAADGMVARMLREWPKQKRERAKETTSEAGKEKKRGGAKRVEARRGRGGPRVIATGGLAPLIMPIATRIDTLDLDLALHGLRVAAESLGRVR